MRPAISIAWRRITLVPVLLAAVVGAVLLSPDAATAAAGNDGKKPDVVCYYDESYSVTSRNPNEFVPVGTPWYNQNDSDIPHTYTITWTQTGTISLTLTGTLNMKGSVIIADVSSELSVATSLSISVTGSTSTQATVPAHSHVYEAFGVWRIDTWGTYYMFSETPSCSSKSASAHAKTPSYRGWHSWQ